MNVVVGIQATEQFLMQIENIIILVRVGRVVEIAATRRGGEGARRAAADAENIANHKWKPSQGFQHQQLTWSEMMTASHR